MLALFLFLLAISPVVYAILIAATENILFYSLVDASRDGDDQYTRGGYFTVEEVEIIHTWMFRRKRYRRDPMTGVYYAIDGSFLRDGDRLTSVMRNLNADAKSEAGAKRAWETK